MQKYFDKDHVINKDNAGFNYRGVRDYIEDKIRKDAILGHYFSQARHYYQIICDETNNSLNYSKNPESAVLYIEFKFELPEEYHAVEEKRVSIEGIRICHVFKIEVEYSINGSVLIKENEQDLSLRKNSEYIPDSSMFFYILQEERKKEIKWQNYQC